MLKYVWLGLFILSVCISPWGCTHKTYYEPDATDRYYTPQPLPLKSGMIHQPDFKIAPTVTLINAQTNTDWSPLGAFTHPWFGNLRLWTDTAVEVVSSELKRRGVAVTHELPLILKLTINPADNGGALTGLLARECPLDTDSDGIPDYLDRCPGTPKGAVVDHLGCPVDTDKDSLPDYRDYCPTIPQGYKIDHMEVGERGPCLSKDMPAEGSGRRETYLVSLRTADTVIRLFKNALEKNGIAAQSTGRDAIRFSLPTSDWDEKIKTIQKTLKTEDILITETSPRLLQLAITDASLTWDSLRIGCTLNLRVITGEGNILDLSGTHYAIDIHDSCDGAVTKQAAAMFNNVQARNYLAASAEPKDSDCDGVTDDIDECPGTPLGIAVDAKGCPLDTKVDSVGCPPDSDGDGVADYLDKCPGTPKGAKVDREGCWIIDEPLFDFDKYDIKPQYYPALDVVATVLLKNPSLRIVIEGYTDNVGTQIYNQKLSKERAEAVKQYLTLKGIQDQRLSTVGYGFSMPKASNETPEGRAQNRRVRIEPLPVPAN